jgi:hypothetical protein
VTDDRIADAARDALALAVACSETDREGADAILATYDGRPRELVHGFLHVIRSLAMTRVICSGAESAEAAIAAELRSLLTGPFAECG